MTCQFLAIAGTPPGSMSRPLLLGHRGARACKQIPENTLASFDRALADGCDGFEFDARLTEDRHPVICHDANFGKSRIARSKAEQLTALPRLEDVLSRYPGAFLDIELKVRGLEQICAKQLREFHREHFVISSFLPEVLKLLHALDPELPLGLICETKSQLERWSKLPVHYVIPHYRIARRNLIRELHKANKRVLVWTVNQSRQMKQFAAWEADGIISDDTKLLRQTLAPEIPTQPDTESAKTRNKNSDRNQLIDRAH
jgi:glycerophosphoryl diester phosphodiesterase